MFPKLPWGRLSRSSLWAIAALAFALLLLALSAEQSAAFKPAQNTSATPTTSTTAIPITDDNAILAPFPPGGTAIMTTTVQAVLDTYLQITKEQAGVSGPLAVANTARLVYMPIVYKAQAILPTPTPIPQPSPSADMAVTIWPSPSIIVMRGGTLAYELRLKNYGRGDASSVVVTLPYNRNLLGVIGSRFNDSHDWVSSITDEKVEVTFGPVESDEYRTATIYFRVSDSQPDLTVISMRAGYSWDDARDGGTWQSNWAPVLIGAGNASATWVWLAVDPLSGASGTTFHFFTDRYIPGEGIITWLNTPTGVKPLDLRGVADPMGRVWLDFSSSGLQPGSYQLVLYGARSNLTAVATFTVR